MTMGTDIAAAVGGACGRGGCSTFGGSVAPCDPYSVKLVAVEFDFLNIIVQYPVQKFIRGACNAPSVFLRAGNGQAVGFGGLLEILVVVCSSAAAILHIGDFVVVLVAHFMENRAYRGFNGAVQRSGGNVDFLVPLSLDAPCVIQGIMSVASATALNGDHRAFKFAGEKVGVQLVIELFQITGKAAVFGQFFHGVRSLSFNNVVVDFEGAGGYTKYTRSLCGCGSSPLHSALVGVWCKGLVFMQ